MTKIRECANCGYRTFYKKRHCMECGSQQWDKQESGIGELLAITSVHVSPKGVRKPNRLGLAKFEGANLVAQIGKDLNVGDNVKIDNGNTLREEDDGTQVGAQFVPAGD
ncbi:hypothetical protein SAMN04487948_11811 [Halogranum amylolyticum]|uniref:ChsH2 rubredoxin-like zinc ribbon domain-containing protein n=1 Tax=Halogranum amylolyticum TaxID=660520 RepID=A0A1H8VP84_9EURY|nr:zinc ribbon domain-containing protein [Halogranum amylolyticum]SEP16718.1 hypothetical protein SAMN04487948_11811 [Halogranum amylolyticum]